MRWEGIDEAQTGLTCEFPTVNDIHAVQDHQATDHQATMKPKNLAYLGPALSAAQM